MLSVAVVELDDVGVLLPGAGDEHLARHGEDGAVVVPLAAHAGHARVHQRRRLVVLVLHHLHPPVVVADDCQDKICNFK